MYICSNCEGVFDEPKTIIEHHPYGMGTAGETWSVCPYCNGAEFSEALQCERCGEYFEELQDGLCDCCYGDVYG